MLANARTAGFRLARSLCRVLLCVAALAATPVPASAGQLKLAWDATANALGYRVYYGTASGSYTNSVDVKNVTSSTIAGLTDGARYYLAVKAYGPTGTPDSAYSNEISAVVPAAAVPAASFTASPVTGTAPLTVTLTDTTSGTLTGRTWSLGDGTTASSQTVAKTYTAPGTYTVVLTIATAAGSSTSSKTITVAAAPPVAGFSATPVSGTSPLTVNFTDASAGTVSTWAWDFGDGGKSTAKNPSYTYTVAGNYSVSLTVTGPSGSNKVTKAGLVSVSAPVASSSPSPSTPAPAPVTVANGLVAAYGFEEGSGSQVRDASGNGNHGSISGATRTSTRHFGKAMQFNGGGNLITVSDSASLDLTRGMTIEAWIRPTGWKTQWHTIAAKERSGGGIYGLFVTHDGARPSTIIEVGGAERILIASPRVPLKAWTHIATTYDGTAQKLYVNGALVGSRPQSGPIDVSTGALRIGGNSIWGEYFKGLIDEVRIYNRALAPAEIVADSRQPVVALVMSTAANRANPVPLDGAPVSGKIYPFYLPIGPALASNPVQEVRFWLDDPQPSNPTGTPRQIERQTPYDFAGTMSDGTAGALDTTRLAAGVHTISARVTLRDGTVLPVMTGRFTIR